MKSKQGNTYSQKTRLQTILYDLFPDEFDETATSVLARSQLKVTLRSLPYNITNWSLFLSEFGKHLLPLNGNVTQ